MILDYSKKKTNTNSLTYQKYDVSHDIYIMSSFLNREWFSLCLVFEFWERSEVINRHFIGFIIIIVVFYANNLFPVRHKDKKYNTSFMSWAAEDTIEKSILNVLMFFLQKNTCQNNFTNHLIKKVGVLYIWICKHLIEGLGGMLPTSVYYDLCL